MKTLLHMAEKNWLPDWTIRYGIRRRNKNHLVQLHRYDPELLITRNMRFYNDCSKTEVALSTKEANQQHYVLPTRFFQLVLGNHLKYSGSLFLHPDTSLSEAELKTLDLYAKRAQLFDGQAILDLSYGWGSLSLFLANNYPSSSITAVSNSRTQKEYIDKQAELRGLTNINVITCDINVLKLPHKYDRILSVEMLEHVTNHREVFKRIASWLEPDGLFFTHIFTRIQAAYNFEVESDDDWMAKYFFTSGLMPSSQQFLYFQDDLVINNHWIMNGKHYQKTANAWLCNIDMNKTQISKVFKETYGRDYLIWLQRWRIFFMACAELFGYKKRIEWLISHYLFSPRL